MALLFITHDLNLVRRFCHRVGVMEKGGWSRAAHRRGVRAPAASLHAQAARQPAAARGAAGRGRCAGAARGARRPRRLPTRAQAGSGKRTLRRRARRDAAAAAAARRSASSANRARARRRSAWRCSRCSRSRARRDHARRHARIDDAAAPRLARDAPAHAGGVPGSVRVAEPAHDGRADRRRGPGAAPAAADAGRARRSASSTMLAEVGLIEAHGVSRRAAALSARILRRPAPAHRDRARRGAAPGGAGARRADLGARRLGAAAGAGAARRAAAPATA